MLLLEKLLRANKLNLNFEESFFELLQIDSNLFKAVATGMIAACSHRSYCDDITESVEYDPDAHQDLYLDPKDVQYFWTVLNSTGHPIKRSSYQFVHSDDTLHTDQETFLSLIGFPGIPAKEIVKLATGILPNEIYNGTVSSMIWSFRYDAGSVYYNEDELIFARYTMLRFIQAYLSCHYVTLNISEVDFKDKAVKSQSVAQGNLVILQGAIYIVTHIDGYNDLSNVTVIKLSDIMTKKTAKQKVVTLNQITAISFRTRLASKDKPIFRLPIRGENK